MFPHCVGLQLDLPLLSPVLLRRRVNPLIVTCIISPLEWRSILAKDWSPGHRQVLEYLWLNGNRGFSFRDVREKKIFPIRLEYEGIKSINYYLNKMGLAYRIHACSREFRICVWDRNYKLFRVITR